MIFQFSRWFKVHPRFCFDEVFFGPSGNGEWLRSTMDTTSPMFVHLQGVTWWTDMKLDKFEEIDIQTKIIIWPWNILGFEGFVFRDSFTYQKGFLQIISKMYNIEMIVPWSEKKNIGCISCQRFKALVLFGIPASIPFQRPETSSTGEV